MLPTCKILTSDLKTYIDYKLINGKDISCKWKKRKKAGIAMLISDKMDFKTKTVIKDKVSHYIMIKGSMQEEDIILINIYAPNIGTLKCIKQILIDVKSKINAITIIVGDFNTHLCQ